MNVRPKRLSRCVVVDPLVIKVRCVFSVVSDRHICRVLFRIKISIPITILPKKNVSQTLRSSCDFVFSRKQLWAKNWLITKALL